MAKNRRRAPFVKFDTTVFDEDETVQWLEPVLMCQVAYKEWQTGQTLTRPRFKAMLANVDETG